MLLSSGTQVFYKCSCMLKTTANITIILYCQKQNLETIRGEEIVLLRQTEIFQFFELV